MTIENMHLYLPMYKDRMQFNAKKRFNRRQASLLLSKNIIQS
jgi:hypothetical protein